MPLNFPPPNWLALKAALHKRLGFAPPKLKFRGSYQPAGPDSEGWQRHLLYFCYPIAGNGVWQRNIDQLKRRLDLFNGQRWVAIATPSQRVWRADDLLPSDVQKVGERHVLDTARDVVRHLGETAANYIITPHPARKLGEVLAFSTLWEQLQAYAGPRDVTFYAHTKGAGKPVAPGISVHLWADLMYAANLDFWPDVAKLLETHCTVGAFKKIGWFRGDTRQTKWHYHGTFMWARNRDVFARGWRKVKQKYGGTEMWAGQIFEDSEAACIFYGGDDVDMYNPNDARRALGCLNLWPWPVRTMTKPEYTQAMREFISTL